MSRLSVNLNKIALLRNSRDIGIPRVIKAVEINITAGAQGITVHPRPNQRHIRMTEFTTLRSFCDDIPTTDPRVAIER